jgi:DNA-directed RNA polymerase specialized sigma54-like protein
LIGRLAELETAPGAALQEESAPILRPDLVVAQQGRGFEVTLDRSQLPAVQIDRRVLAPGARSQADRGGAALLAQQASTARAG